MQKLIDKLKPEVIEALNEDLKGYPHLSKKVFAELNSLYFIDDLAFGTIRQISTAAKIDSVSEIHSILK